MSANSTLFDHAILSRGEGNQSLYRYVNKNADITKYSKVFVDRVLIRKEGEMDVDTTLNYQRLAINAGVYLKRELEKQYALADGPGAGVLVVQMAILDADSSKPLRNLVTMVTNVGMAVTLLKYAAVGKPAGVGEISAEFLVTDGETGETLGAVLDRRVGTQMPNGIVDQWYEADSGLQYWAKRLAYVLCAGRKAPGCVQP